MNNIEHQQDINAIIAAIAQDQHRKKEKREMDIMIYEKEIEEVLSFSDNDLNAKKMLLAKNFVAALKKEMQHGLVKAGICWNATIVLFVKKFNSEKNDKIIYDSTKNFANNSHRITELKKVFSEQTGISINYTAYYYNKNDFDRIKEEKNLTILLE